jgi:intracellular sulfur oxidation DsrE/DsrF family protein
MVRSEKDVTSLQYPFKLYSQKLAERTQIGSHKESNGLGGDRPAQCGNTRENMTRVEAKDIPIISQAKVVNAGVVRLIELQERGWSYLRP